MRRNHSKKRKPVISNDPPKYTINGNDLIINEGVTNFSDVPPLNNVLDMNFKYKLQLEGLVIPDSVVEFIPDRWYNHSNKTIDISCFAHLKRLTVFSKTYDIPELVRRYKKNYMRLFSYNEYMGHLFNYCWGNYDDYDETYAENNITGYSYAKAQVTQNLTAGVLSLFCNGQFDKDIFVDYMSEKQKYEIIFSMLKHNPKNSQFWKMIKDHPEIITCLIKNLRSSDKSECVQSLLDNGIFTNQNIDNFIREAFDSQEHEIQVMLTNYKYHNLDFVDIFDKLKL